MCSGTENVNGEAVSYAKKTTEYLYSKANVITLESEIYQNAEGGELARRNTRYVYDKAGNQTSKTTEFITNAVEGAEYDVNLGESSVIEVTINEYNGLNQLVGSTAIKGETRTYSSYVYNGDNLRTQKTVGNETTDYVLSGDYVIAETNKTYIFGLSYHGYTSADATYWYFTNSHGDVTCVVDSSKATAAEYDYDEFGNVTYQDGNIDNDVLYSGEFYDSESENYYLRARYYDPSIGRFTQQDTFLGVHDNPLSLNRYTYCHNNPIMFVDPNGHEERSITIGDYTYGYNTDSFTSSEMDYEFSKIIGTAQRGELSATAFLRLAYEYNVPMNLINANVEIGENIYTQFNTTSVLSYSESLRVASFIESYKAGETSREYVQKNLKVHGVVSYEINAAVSVYVPIKYLSALYGGTASVNGAKHYPSTPNNPNGWTEAAFAYVKINGNYKMYTDGESDAAYWKDGTMYVSKDKFLSDFGLTDIFDWRTDDNGEYYAWIDFSNQQNINLTKQNWLTHPTLNTGSYKIVDVQRVSIDVGDYHQDEIYYLGESSGGSNLAFVVTESMDIPRVTVSYAGVSALDNKGYGIDYASNFALLRASENSKGKAFFESNMVAAQVMLESAGYNYAYGSILNSFYIIGSISSNSSSAKSVQNWERGLTNTSQLSADDFQNLTNKGTVKVNSSGSNRPLTSSPNSFYHTGNGEHIFVYDQNGQLIYDISKTRVKGFKINTSPSGNTFYQPYKLTGGVPDAIKNIFGW